MATLITGGTGSFGHAFLDLARGIDDVVVLSRDEEKQRRMARDYPDVRFVIGDVRDRDSLRRAMRGVDRVFHAAALKQVPQAEANVLEYVRTNVLGTENVCAVAAEAGARVVVLSTDKAVEPVGVMGASKLLAEGVARNWGANCVRYGNVVGSRGSIIPVWRDQVRRREPVTITDPAMTRFLITLPEAVGLVLTAFEAPGDGSVYVRKSPAATVAQIARVFRAMQPVRTSEKVIGTRPGEKLHEHLTAPGERSDDLGDYLRIHPSGADDRRYGSQDACTMTDEALADLLAQAPAGDYA